MDPMPIVTFSLFVKVLQDQFKRHIKASTRGLTPKKDHTRNISRMVLDLFVVNGFQKRGRKRWREMERIRSTDNMTSNRATKDLIRNNINKTHLWAIVY